MKIMINREKIKYHHGKLERAMVRQLRHRPL